MIGAFDLFGIGFNILIAGILPFINKKLLQNIESFPYTAIRWIIGGILGICIIPFHQQIYNQNVSFYFIIALLSIFSFISSNIYSYLLKNYNANTISVIINPFIILSSAIFGTMLFNEPFTYQMWVGTFIMLIGLVIFIKGKI